MTSRFRTLAVDALDPAGLARFWCAALGYQVLDDDPDVLTIGLPDGPGPTIDLLRVPADERKQVKNRMHLDLVAEDLSTHDELARLLALGARRVDVGQGPDVTWVVLADPEGNEFCLLG